LLAIASLAKQLLRYEAEYSIQDSICLYKALLEAQQLYYINYNVDIVKNNILSSSTLSLQIFRKKFLNKNIVIPIIAKQLLR
jgi:hypothetical protein